MSASRGDAPAGGINELLDPGDWLFGPVIGPPAELVEPDGGQDEGSIATQALHRTVLQTARLDHALEK